MIPPEVFSSFEIDGVCKVLSSATSYTDSAVSVNQTKTYTMRCIDKNGNTVSGYNSKGWSKKYTPVAPIISKLENTSGGIKLSWNKIAGVYGYRLYYKTSSGGWKRFKDTTSACKFSVKSVAVYTCNLAPCYAYTL